MCGIAGILISEDRSVPILPRISSMARVLAHRGPDSKGEWSDTSRGVGLAHRRLSIVDLSTKGSQPVQSANKRFVLVYNGEIYNHHQLRVELASSGEKIPWRGNSDSETLIECISAWGLNKTLQAIVGMFAFAVWDSQTEQLTLARDRMGEKPLYYGVSKGILAFSSEIKGFQAIPEFELDIDPLSVGTFLKIGYVPGPETIFAGIRKLSPGTSVEIDKTAVAAGKLPPEETYWSLLRFAESAQRKPFPSIDGVEIRDATERVISEAVKSQMMGDVPVGAFLSGGIDSTLVSTLMQQHSAKPIETFSLGFEDSLYDESNHARLVSNLLGTNHNELVMTAKDGLHLLPSLPMIFDEPFADNSQLPSVLLAKYARTRVGVSLTGDGGDELFGGYSRYLSVSAAWRIISRLPMSARKALGTLLSRGTIQHWDRALKPFLSLLQGARVSGSPGLKVHQISHHLQVADARELFFSRLSLIDQPPSHVEFRKPSWLVTDDWPLAGDLLHQMMYADSVTFLPGDILVKVDRSTMAVGLESRMPFLDHRVVEFAWSLPTRLKVSGGETKFILREILAKTFERGLFERPKRGFVIPMERWLRSDLREWADDILLGSGVSENDYLDANVVRMMWRQHLSGERDWQASLWRILVLQTWLDTYRTGAPRQCG